MMTVMFGKERQSSWSVIGECIQGASHKRQHIPCQDALQYTYEGTGVICALADGHGSPKCKYSGDGAKIGVAVALEMMQTMTRHHSQELYRAIKHEKDVSLPKKLEQTWKEEVKTFHKLQNREELEDDKALYLLYGTTLLIVYITDEFIFSLQIGDGDILMVFENGRTSWLIEPEIQYGTETYSLCQKGSWKYFKNKLILVAEQIQLPILFLAGTDGYANSFINAAEFLKIGKDYLELIKNQPIEVIESGLKEWLQESSACGSGDDISLALIYRNCLSPSCGG